MDTVEEKKIRVPVGDLNADGLFLFRCIIMIMIIIMLQMTQNLWRRNICKAASVVM